MGNLVFLKAGEKDLETILDIYNYYIATSTATFDIDPVSKEELLHRIFINHEKYQTFLIHYNQDTIGYCFLTQFKKKKGYDRTAETGLYLKPQFINKGFGKEIVAFLEQIATNQNIKVLVACICTENLASINLMQKMGYEQCTYYKQVGEKFGRLLDVVEFQKIL